MSNEISDWFICYFCCCRIWDSCLVWYCYDCFDANRFSITELEVGGIWSATANLVKHSDMSIVEMSGSYSAFRDYQCMKRRLIVR